MQWIKAELDVSDTHREIKDVVEPRLFSYDKI